ncbi:MAG TPA: type III-B CRISPR module-associated Cmr3 family protein, partial [Thermoguttaceae bacterium]|nr:type III-B CRISPR module-associated Cmr3 family protein [Thermoguttaceae bacterium]
MSLDNQTTSGKQRVGLWLESLDVLFFRDGRPFSAATRVRSGPPMPQTLAGAIWTALLRQAGCDIPRLMATYRTKIE